MYDVPYVGPCSSVFVRAHKFVAMACNEFDLHFAAGLCMMDARREKTAQRME